MFPRNHRGSYIGWPTREPAQATRRRVAARPRSPPTLVKPAATAAATAAATRLISPAPLDLVLAQVISEWTQSRRESMARETELKKLLYAQAQRILALETELAAERQRGSKDANIPLPPLPPASLQPPIEEDLKQEVSNDEDEVDRPGASHPIGSITLLSHRGNNTDKDTADIHILLNSHTTPRWRARPGHLGKILAETILDKGAETAPRRENDAMRLTILCVMGEEGDRVVKNLTRESESVQVNKNVCVYVCIALDKAAVQSLVDAKLGGPDSLSGLKSSVIFASAGTLLLDLIGSHTLWSEEWYVGRNLEKTRAGFMC
jgi:hypothetical protein